MVHVKKYLPVPTKPFTGMSKYLSKSVKITAIPENILAVQGKSFLHVFH